LPAPVSVIVDPLIVADPLTTLKVGIKPLLAVALTVNGASPKVLSANAPNVIVCDAAVTVKLVVTSGAALMVPFPTWFAATTTVPTPVKVSVLPEIVAGPDFTLNVTTSPEVAVGAVIVNGEIPKTLSPIAAKDPSVCVVTGAASVPLCPITPLSPAMRIVFLKKVAPFSFPKNEGAVTWVHWAPSVEITCTVAAVGNGSPPAKYTPYP
jgi:hypothetical protein